MCNPIPRVRSANKVRWLTHARTRCLNQHSHTQTNTHMRSHSCENAPMMCLKHARPPPARCSARVPNISAYNECAGVLVVVVSPSPCCVCVGYACATYKFTHCPMGTFGPMRAHAKTRAWRTRRHGVGLCVSGPARSNRARTERLESMLCVLVYWCLCGLQNIGNQL